MLNNVIIKLVKGPTCSRRADVEALLFEICDSVHSQCNSKGCDCPVRLLMTEDEAGGWDCDCFKNGKKMYDFIEERA